jgi:hypothetical protein
MHRSRCALRSPNRLSRGYSFEKRLFKDGSALSYVIYAFGHFVAVLRRASRCALKRDIPGQQPECTFVDFVGTSESVSSLPYLRSLLKTTRRMVLQSLSQAVVNRRFHLPPPWTRFVQRFGFSAIIWIIACKAMNVVLMDSRMDLVWPTTSPLRWSSQHFDVYARQKGERFDGFVQWSWNQSSKSYNEGHENMQSKLFKRKNFSPVRNLEVVWHYKMTPTRDKGTEQRTFKCSSGSVFTICLNNCKTHRVIQ